MQPTPASDRPALSPAEWEALWQAIGTNPENCAPREEWARLSPTRRAEVAAEWGTFWRGLTVPAGR